MNTRKKIRKLLMEAASCFILVVLMASACTPHTLPTPTLDTLEHGMANGAIANSGRSDLPVYLHWTPGSPVEAGRDSYELEFLSGANQSLLSYVIDNSTNNNLNILRHGDTFPFPLLLTRQGQSGLDFFQILNLRVECGQTYGWHVRQLRADAISDWSETWTFQVGASPTNAPTQAWPAEGEHIQGGQLTWDAPTGAHPEIQYEYEISGARNISGAVFLSSESHSPDLLLEHGGAAIINLQNGQRYFWHVRAYYYPDCAGPWSPMRMFIWDGPTAEVPAGLPPPSAICPPEGCGGEPTLTPPPPPPTWTPLVSTQQVGVFGQVVQLPTDTPEFSVGKGTSLQNLTCRTGPGIVFPALGYISAGASVDIRGRSSDGTWLLIQSCSGSKLGWALAKLIDLKFDPAILPVIVSPPTPTPTDVPPTDTAVPPIVFDCTAAYGASSAACSSDIRCTYNFVIKSCVNK
jgi:uncharacterized protein YraI